MRKYEHRGREDMIEEDPAMDSSILGAEGAAPNAGEVLRRLRLQRKLSLKEVAEAVELSPSFLSAVERGQSDIALGRLARLAQYFDHDVGSLLGYTARRSQPQFVGDSDRLLVHRGKGVRYEVLRIPGVDSELILLDFEPHSGFDNEMAHPGVDIVLVTHGEIVITLSGVDYRVSARECVVYSAAYKHCLRNDSLDPASVVAVVTESIY